MKASTYEAGGSDSGTADARRPTRAANGSGRAVKATGPTSLQLTAAAGGRPKALSPIKGGDRA